MFSNLKVGTRLSIAFGLVVVLLGAVVTVGVDRMAQINTGVRHIAEENNVEMLNAQAMRKGIFETSLGMRNTMLYTAPALARKPKAQLRVAGNAALQAQPDESQFTRFT
jgi:hypothetical protein